MEISDLLYRWENSSGRRMIELQYEIIKIYEKASFMTRRAIKSRVNDYYKFSGEGLTFHDTLVGIDMIIREKESERKRNFLP